MGSKDVLRIRQENRPEYLIVTRLDSYTAIGRRWAEGVLDADPACRVCATRGRNGCVTLTTAYVPDDEAARDFDACKLAALARAGVPIPNARGDGRQESVQDRPQLVRLATR